MSPTLKAHLLLKRNIDALLMERHMKRKDLAQWCHRTEAWLSQIFTNEERNIPLKYLDRIADFFGLATYQLFQPGVTGLTERRRGPDRRVQPERRRSRQTFTPTASALLTEIQGLKPTDVPHVRKYVAWLKRSADDGPGTGFPGVLPGGVGPRAARARRSPGVLPPK